jgi:hypothetical protein
MHIKFLQGIRKGHSFELFQSNSTIDLAGEHILERDAVILTLQSNEPLENVVLHVGGYDLKSEYSEKPDQTYCYTWRPKHTARNGYEALFHNFFGIAQLFVGYTLLGDHQRHYFAYQPIEVMATKLTAERTESMVSFITDNSDEGVLNTISPTHLQANQVRNGVAPGELLAMLEKTVQKTYGLCRPIIRNPMTRLRNKLQTQYGTNCQISDDQGMGWMLDNLSVLYPVSDPNDALLEHSGHWYAATEIQSATPHESTNIYENQLIHLFLSRLRQQAERIIEGLTEQQKKFVP